MKRHRASSILVLGLSSLILCAPLGVVAWLMGDADLRAMDAGLMDPSGRATTNAGRICGIVATILACLIALGFLARRLH